MHRALVQARVQVFALRIGRRLWVHAILTPAVAVVDAAPGAVISICQAVSGRFRLFLQLATSIAADPGEDRRDGAGIVAADAEVEHSARNFRAGNFR